MHRVKVVQWREFNGNSTVYTILDTVGLNTINRDIMTNTYRHQKVIIILEIRVAIIKTIENNIKCRLQINRTLVFLTFKWHDYLFIKLLFFL